MWKATIEGEAGKDNCGTGASERSAGSIGRGRERMKSKKEKGTEKGKEDREGKGKV